MCELIGIYMLYLIGKNYDSKNIGLYRDHVYTLHYIHIQSDNPPSITNQIPLSIEKRFSQISSSEDIFYETTPYYDQRIANYGYNEKLTYRQQGENNTLQQIVEDKHRKILF